jgi:hypothetical protein
MTQYKDKLPYIMFTVAMFLEWLLITSVANETRYGFEYGPWGIHMSHGLSSVVSWIVAILLVASYCLLFRALHLWSMLAVMAFTLLAELTWAKGLPVPQSRWDLALAFLFGFFGLFVVALSRVDFVEAARRKLGIGT